MESPSSGWHGASPEDLVPCKLGCGELLHNDLVSFARHTDQNCPMYLKTCDLGCGEKILRKDALVHAQTLCLNRFVDCTLGCDELVQVHALQMHENAYKYQSPSSWNEQDVIHFLARKFNQTEVETIQKYGLELTGKSEMRGEHLKKLSQSEGSLPHDLRSKLQTMIHLQQIPEGSSVGATIISDSQANFKSNGSQETSGKQCDFLASRVTHMPNSLSERAVTETAEINMPNSIDERTVTETAEINMPNSIDERTVTETAEINVPNSLDERTVTETTAAQKSYSDERIEPKVVFQRGIAPPPPCTASVVSKVNHNSGERSESEMGNGAKEADTVLVEQKASNSKCLKIPDTELPEKFSKMLKAGVPRAAVMAAMAQQKSAQASLRESLQIVNLDSNMKPAKMKPPIKPFLAGIQSFNRTSLKSSSDSHGQSINVPRKTSSVIEGIAGFNRSSLKHVEKVPQRTAHQKLSGLGGALADAIAKRRLLLQGSEGEDTDDDEFQHPDCANRQVSGSSFGSADW